MKTVQYLSFSEPDVLYIKKLLTDMYGIRNVTDEQVVSHVVLKCPIHKTSLLMAAKNRSLFSYKSKSVDVDDDIQGKISAIAKDIKIKDTKIVLSCLIRLLVNLYKIKFIDFQDTVLT